MKHILAMVFVVFWGNGAFAQSLKTDSSYFLSLTELHQIILVEHPMVQRANLLPKQAQSLIMMAKGSFDPVVAGDFSQKTFKSKTYWTFSDAYFKIPTWIGADIKVNWQQNSGDFLDQSDQTPRTGLNYAGIALPIGRGLLIDQRRASLMQAKSFLEQNQAEQAAMVNKIMLQASKDFALWYTAYKSFLFINDAYILANQRADQVKQRVVLGDAAAIDSVEAVVAAQQRLLERTAAQLELYLNNVNISNYLWKDNQPIQIEPSVYPIFNTENTSALLPDSLLNAIKFARETHPNLQKIRFKGEILETERRLAREMLKPQLNLEAGILQQNPVFSQTLTSNFIQNNYKLGASAYIPIFLRKERGKLNLSNFKIKENDLELSFGYQTIQNDLRMAFEQIKTLEAQLQLAQRMISNYETLRNGEKIRFDNGESSVFLINAREAKLLEAEVKYAELQGKLQKAIAEWRFALGGF